MSRVEKDIWGALSAKQGISGDERMNGKGVK